MLIEAAVHRGMSTYILKQVVNWLCGEESIMWRERGRFGNYTHTYVCIIRPDWWWLLENTYRFDFHLGSIHDHCRDDITATMFCCPVQCSLLCVCMCQVREESVWKGDGSIPINAHCNVFRDWSPTRYIHTLNLHTVRGFHGYKV